MIRALGRTFGCAVLVAAVSVSPSFANADANPTADIPKMLEQVDAATRAGRLVQADAMLTWLEQGNAEGSGEAVAFRRAEYHMAKDDAVLAAAALVRAGVESGDGCRYSKLAGWIAGKKGDWNKAILRLATAIEVCGEDASLWNLFGLALAGKGEYPASLEAFDSALRLEPRHPGLLNNRALARVQAGQNNIAMVDLRQALALAPADAGIRDNVDYLSGAMGIAPVRAAGDSDAMWAARLAKAGEGAQQANRSQMAMAYFANAALLSDRFDAKIWAQGALATDRKVD